MSTTSATPAMYQGFIYKAFALLVDILRFLNPFEWFKEFGKMMAGNAGTEKKVRFARIFGDLFIVIKWALIIFFVARKVEGHLAAGICWWLIIANLFSFFDYLVWKEYAPGHIHDKKRIRRRFIHLIIALFFSNFCFAYLYAVPYKADFTWKHETSFWDSMQFSISNSIAGNYEFITPLYGNGVTYTTIQFLITFLFVSIILNRAIPD